MSHFAVMVVTKEKPTQEVLHQTLLPWHEHECTGYKEYCIWIDKTEEYKKEFEESTVERCKSPSGLLFSRFDDAGNYNPKFYRRAKAGEVICKGELFGEKLADGLDGSKSYLPDSDGYDWCIFELPEGYEPVEIPRKEVEEFEEWAKDWHGAEPIPDKPGRYGCFTNPNARWDWWVIGGRYAGRLLEKQKTQESYGGRLKGGVDVCQRSNLDFEGMLAGNRAARETWWVGAEGMFLQKMTTNRTFAEALNRHQAIIDEAREQREEGQALSDVLKGNEEWAQINHEVDRAKMELFGIFSDVAPRDITKQKYIDAAKAFSTYAVVKDGNWYQKGEMGWWGMSSNEMTDEEWSAKVDELLKDTPGDHWITVVDCHI